MKGDVNPFFFWQSVSDNENREQVPIVIKVK